MCAKRATTTTKMPAARRRSQGGVSVDTAARCLETALAACRSGEFFTYSSAEAPAQQPHRGDRARCSRLPRGGDGYPLARSRRLRSSRLARDRRRRGRVSRSAPEKFGATPGARRLRSTACPVSPGSVVSSPGLARGPRLPALGRWALATISRFVSEPTLALDSRGDWRKARCAALRPVPVRQGGAPS